jgi:predicted metal-dependent hydrolase
MIGSGNLAQALLTTHLDLNGENVTLRVKHNPRARRMILRIDHTSGEVVVTSPTKKAMKDAVAFAVKESTWIAEKLANLPKTCLFADGAKIPLRGELATLRHRPEKRRGVWFTPQTQEINISGEAEFLGRRLEDFFRKEAKSALTERVASFTKTLEMPLPKITVRDTTSRWGSCSSSGTLSFSWRLILAPTRILNYVAAHEVAHLLHHNHSKAFWNQVEALDPDHKACETWMKGHAADLFRYRRPRA